MVSCQYGVIVSSAIVNHGRNLLEGDELSLLQKSF
jgi:hypothetical protein